MPYARDAPRATIVMFHIILHQPEIAPNTGNSIRLSANTGCHLHLVEPLGFHFADRHLQRAGLDYHDLARVTRHVDWAHCRAHFAGQRIFALSTKAEDDFFAARFQPGDAFLFGAETRGLPQAVLEDAAITARLRLPMMPANRSMNLSNTVAVVIFEAWRQQGFAGAASAP